MQRMVFLCDQGEEGQIKVTLPLLFALSFRSLFTLFPRPKPFGDLGKHEGAKVRGDR